MLTLDLEIIIYFYRLYSRIGTENWVRNWSGHCSVALKQLRIIDSHGETQNCPIYAVIGLCKFGFGGGAYAPVWCWLAPHGHHGTF